jgi:hypothetical protein
VGSFSVIYVILKDRRKNLKMVYQRLMLGMSVMDVIATGGLTIMNGWAIPVGTESFSGWHSWTATPQGTSEFYGARGTVTTCNFAGMFMNLIPTSAGTYSTLLSFYYLLVLRYEKRERWIARYVEPVIHILAIPLPLILGAIAWHMEYFNPMTGLHGWCWLRDAPDGCSKDDAVECDRGEGYLSYSQIVVVVSFGGFIVIIVDMILIVLKVRAIEKRLVRYLIGDSNDNTLKRTRQTGIQALLYIGSYFITYSFTVFWYLPISNPTAAFALACLIKITLPLQGFWNALIYMRPYYKAYFKQKKKLRIQKELQQASADPSAIISTAGKTCPPSMESSDIATDGEVPPPEEFGRFSQRGRSDRFLRKGKKRSIRERMMAEEANDQISLVLSLLVYATSVEVFASRRRLSDLEASGLDDSQALSMVGESESENMTSMDDGLIKAKSLPRTQKKELSKYLT